MPETRELQQAGGWCPRPAISTRPGA